MSAHTPSPWNVERGIVVATIYSGLKINSPFAEVYLDRERVGDAGNANLALITTAPVMYAACKVALAALQGESQLDRANAIKALRDAIAKAEA